MKYQEFKKRFEEREASTDWESFKYISSPCEMLQRMASELAPNQATADQWTERLQNETK